MKDFDFEKFLVARWRCGESEFFTFVIPNEDWPGHTLTPDFAEALIHHLRPDRKKAFAASSFAGRHLTVEPCSSWN